MNNTITKQRNSAVELLKIIGMFLIVLSHVAHTLGHTPDYLSEYNNVVYNLSLATADFKAVILRIFLYFGNLGNAIFFVCSSWFLCELNKAKKEKVAQIIVDAWLISMIIVSCYLLSPEKISTVLIIKSFFPTIFQNNWYISCYILFYLVVPFLNQILDSLERKRYLKINIVLLGIYFIIGFVLPDSFQANNLIEFFVIHTYIFYMKKYMRNLFKHRKTNLFILLTSLLILLTIIISLNYIGLHMPMIQDKMMKFSNMQNPFIILIAFSSLMIALNNEFYNSFINKISSLSLLIYILHENIIFSAYTRLRIEAYLVKSYGKENILLIVLLFAIVLFVVSALISYIYQNTIQKLTKKASSFLLDRFIFITNSFVEFLIKFAKRFN